MSPCHRHHQGRPRARQHAHAPLQGFQLRRAAGSTVSSGRANPESTWRASDGAGGPRDGVRGRRRLEEAACCCHCSRVAPRLLRPFAEPRATGMQAASRAALLLSHAKPLRVAAA
eukprot:scaffold39_cov66-Phaeocystis_antarctica.AAC.6